MLWYLRIPNLYSKFVIRNATFDTSIKKSTYQIEIFRLTNSKFLSFDIPNSKFWHTYLKIAQNFDISTLNFDMPYPKFRRISFAILTYLSPIFDFLIQMTFWHTERKNSTKANYMLWNYAFNQLVLWRVVVQMYVRVQQTVLATVRLSADRNCTGSTKHDWLRTTYIATGKEGSLDTVRY